jgi:hypothetical protein
MTNPQPHFAAGGVFSFRYFIYSSVNKFFNSIGLPLVVVSCQLAAGHAAIVARTSIPPFH